jgi:hypothetical protein
MFPFVHPERTKEILTDLGKAKDYDFSTPVFKRHPVPIRTYNAVTDILKNQRGFKVPCKSDQTFLNRAVSSSLS